MLGPKLKGLPDNHPSKPECLHRPSELLGSVGNFVENRCLLVCILELWREQGNNLKVAETLGSLAETNWLLNLYEEGIPQAKESLGIFEQLNDTSGQAESLHSLAQLLYKDNQLDAAEEAALQALNLHLDKDEQLRVCQVYDTLGDICHSKGETEEAVNYFKLTLGIASSFNWHNQQFWALYSLVELFFDEGRFGDAHAHIECARLHVVNDPYCLGCAMHLQAWLYYSQCRLEEAKSEALCTVNVFEKLGASRDVERCRELLQWIEEDMNNPVISSK
jgi:tetratricopeptide (TPR) repeat protein